MRTLFRIKTLLALGFICASFSQTPTQARTTERLATGELSSLLHHMALAGELEIKWTTKKTLKTLAHHWILNTDIEIDDPEQLDSFLGKRRTEAYLYLRTHNDEWARELGISRETALTAFRHFDASKDHAKVSKLEMKFNPKSLRALSPKARLQQIAKNTRSILVGTTREGLTSQGQVCRISFKEKTKAHAISFELDIENQRALALQFKENDALLATYQPGEKSRLEISIGTTSVRIVQRPNSATSIELRPGAYECHLN